jgi:hypothetical protein
MENTLEVNRTFNFGLLRYLHRGHEHLVEKLKGMSNWKEVSDFALGRRTISASKARSIEVWLKLPSGWLDHDHRGYLNAGADVFSLFTLIDRAPPQVREATRTLLAHVATPREIGLDAKGGSKARLSLVATRT